MKRKGEAQMLSEDGEGTAAPVAVLSCAVCGAVVADTSTSSVEATPPGFVGTRLARNVKCGEESRADPAGPSGRLVRPVICSGRPASGACGALLGHASIDSVGGQGPGVYRFDLSAVDTYVVGSGDPPGSSRDAAADGQGSEPDSLAWMASPDMSDADKWRALQDHLKAQDNDMLNVFNMIMLHAEQIQQLQGAVLSKGAP